MKQKVKKQQEVHVLTEKVSMRFTPLNKSLREQQERIQYNQHALSNTPSNAIWRYFSFLSNNRYSQKLQKMFRNQKIMKNQSENVIKSQGEQASDNKSTRLKEEKRQKLKYALRLSPEHILIGNEYQLDVFYININSNNYVQTQYLWSITKKHKITHVCLEEKKFNLLLIIAQKQVSIYRYDAKKFPSQLIPPLKYIYLNQAPLFAQIVKEGNICLFFSHHVEVFVLNEGVRRRYNGKYQLPQSKQSKFSLFLVPEHSDNYVNVFFSQKTESQSTFTLWCIEMQFMSVQIKCFPIQKIYQIKKSFKNTIKLTNYSKQIFLLNLGNEILALKRGYILDSVYVTMKTQQSLFEYLTNGTLCHISPKRVQVYKFSVNILVKPSKIIIKSQDSIKIEGTSSDQQFLKILPILNNDFLIIFQKKPQFNLRKNGQIQYSLYVTRKMSREDKMKQLFPKNLREFKIDDEKLLQKCNIAEKMGYTIKQIYLELWLRSAQSNKSDYRLLIATRDYNTITEQVIRKLKKASLNFRQILNIEQACIQMLKQKVFGSNCTFDIFMNYINSHFFIRKLQMFRDIEIMEKMMKEDEQGKQHNQALKMTIRQYQFYKNMEIKAQLIEYIRLFCQEENKELVKYIRFLLRNFKFVFRTIYQQILEDIIINANHKLLILLKQIPEILPYQPLENDRPVHIPSGYYDGVWAQITNQQWKESLYVDALVTIDNKFVVQEEVIKSIPFKRNWLSQHDMITQSTQKIKKIEEQLSSPHIFYFFIAKLFEHAKDRDSFVLRGIVQYIEETYTWENQSLRKSQMPDQSLRKSSTSSRKQQIAQSKIPGIPENIIGKVFLLQKIFRFFHEKKILPLIDNRPISLSQFFDYSDPQLIRYCFEKERSFKGILLRDIKDIYKTCLPFTHSQMFNKALLNYFISDLSEVSDLKYLLNRINNQKKQFHKENKEMYAVLIEALERKLKIGTSNDIPIDQVLIYLQNIPLHTSYSETEINATLQQLRIVEIINKESQFLRQSKINMSIYDILRNPEEVFTKLIDFAVNQSSPEVWESSQTFQEFAVAKLVQVQQFSSNIYNNRDPQNIKNYDSTIFFIFLAKVCEDIKNIKYVKQFLTHQELQRYEHFTPQGLSEGLVQFMYKWTLYQNNSFLDNFEYIKQLLTLISQNSSTYRFIENELEFAKLLSFRRSQITYPITDSIIGIYDIKSIVNALPIKFVMTIPIQSVFEAVKNIQEVISEQKEQNSKEDSIIPEYSQMDPRSKVTLYQVYEVFIVKYLNQGKVKQCIPLTKKILELPSDGNQRYDIIYPILFIMQISNQLNESNKENLIKCVWYYFFQPQKLMQIIQYILMTPLSPHQMKIQIQDALERGKEKYKGYNKNNPILSHQYLQLAKLSEENEQKFMKILYKTSKRLQQCKQQFKAIKYSMIIAILCNSPYSLAKFIFCHDEKTVKPIRSILSYAILQQVFESLNLLQIGRRVFIIILQSFKKEYPIQSVIREYEEMDINEEIDIFEYSPPDEDKTFEYVMWKSAQAFQKKKMALITDRQSGSRISKKQEKIKQKKQKISQIFENAELSIQSGDPSQYIFQDSDNQDNASDQIENRARSKFQSTFVPKEERNAILRSTKFNKPCALYKSAQADYKFNNRLFVSSSQGFSSIAFGSNLKVYSGHKSLLRQNKCKSREEIQKVPLLRISISHPQISEPHEKHYKMSEIQQQEPESPLKSIPSFDHGMVKISSFGNQELQQRFNNLVTTSQQYIPQKKDPKSESQKSGQPIYQIQNYELPLNSPDKSSEQISNLNENQLKQNSYHIKVYEINDDEDDCLSEEMHETNQNISYQKLADQLFEKNKNISLKQEHNLSVIEKFHNNSKILKEIIKIIYQTHANQTTCHKALKLLQKIIEKQPCLHINSDMFKIFQKIHQVQSKTIPQIPLSSLVTDEIIGKYYSQQRQVFEDIYQNLRKFVGSQNIYKITQFVRRVFDDPTYDQEIIWDFVLDLCEKIDSNQGEQKNWNLEKIQVTFPKVDISICINKFNSFKSKVLEPDARDELLEVFCQEIKIRPNKQHSIVFLGKILQVYRSEKVLQTLSELKSEY